MSPVGALITVVGVNALYRRAALMPYAKVPASSDNHQQRPWAMRQIPASGLCHASHLVVLLIRARRNCRRRHDEPIQSP